MKRWLMLIVLLLSAAALAQTPVPNTSTLFEKLYAPNGSSSQTGTTGLQFADGNFQVDGPWVGTGSNTIEPGLASFTTADPTSFGGAPTGYLNLKINNTGASGCASNLCQGSEIISNTLPGFGYGYYEVRMSPDYTLISPGGVASFFLIQAGGTLSSRTYGPQEFDIEFLLNHSWAGSCSITTGDVQITTHPSGVSNSVSLPFNPACGYHRYGMLWVSGNLGFYADGSLIHTVTSSDVALPTNGMWIMANGWTGDSSFGGGPPASVISSAYDYIKFWPLATTVQNGDPPTDLYAQWSNFPQTNLTIPTGVWSQTPNRTQGSGAAFSSIPVAIKDMGIGMLQGIDNGGGFGYPATCDTDTSNLFADMAAQGVPTALIVFPLSFVNCSGSVVTNAGLYPFTPSPWNSTGTSYTVNNSALAISSATSSALTMTTTVGSCSLDWGYMETNSCSNGPVALVSSVEAMASGLGKSQYLTAYIMGDEPEGGNNGCAGLVANIPTIMPVFQAYDTTRPFLWNETDWIFTHGTCTGSLNQEALQATPIGSIDLYPLTNPFLGLSGTTLDNNGAVDSLWEQGWTVAQMVALGRPNQPVWIFVDGGTNELGFSSQNGTTCSSSTNLCTKSGQDPIYYRAPAELVNAEVMASVINGAVGIEWFSDDVSLPAQGSVTNYDFLLGDGGSGSEQSVSTAISSNVTYIDGVLATYAPMINVGSEGGCTMNTGTSYTSHTTSCSNGILTMSTGNSSVPGSAITRYYNGTLYLFADSDRVGSATMTFTLDGFASDTATVVYDSNAQYDPTHSSVGTTFTLNGSGQFSDTFGANNHNYQPKIYTITAGSGAATAPSCTPGTGSYSGSATVTCTNPNSGTTVMCYSATTTPVTNGLGTGCSTGTLYSTPLTISSTETLNVVAGTSTLTDSSVASYTYTISLNSTSYVNASTGNDSYNCTSATFVSGLNGPCATVARGEAASATGATINIAAGTYRLSTALNSTSGYIAAKANQTFVGASCTPTSAACSTVISGGILLCSGSYTCSGPDGNGNWSVTGMTQQGSVTQPVTDCDAGWAGCLYPEDLFINGVPLQHMSSAVAISGFTGTSGTLTFSAINTLVAGNTITLCASCFTGGNAGLNGQTITVLSAGLTGSAFEAAVTGSGYSSAAGTGTVTNVPTTLTASTWWFDYTNDIIYFHTNPSGQTVETSVLETMFQPNAVNGVTLNNLTVEEFATPFLLGAIDPVFGNVTNASSLNWTIENSYVTLNHSYGVRCAFNQQVLNSVLTVNGVLGTGGSCPATNSILLSGVVIQGNTITFNNYAHSNPGFGGGGAKWGNTWGLVIRNNIIEHNIGQGLHFDDNSGNELADGNTITANVDTATTGGSGSLGAESEISSWTTSTYRNNYIGLNNNGDQSGPNNELASVDSTIAAYCNVVEVGDYAHESGVDIAASARGNNNSAPFVGTYLFSNANSFHHNTVIFDTGTTGTVGYTNTDTTNQSTFFSLNTPPDFNAYHASSTGVTNFIYDNNNSGSNTAINFATFQSNGADIHGTIDTVNTSGYPAVKITSPADQSTVSNPATITATASDGSGISKVEFFVDWILAATVTSGPYNFTWNNGVNGSHVIAAMAFGNDGVTSCWAVTLTNTSVTPPAPATGLFAQVKQ